MMKKALKALRKIGNAAGWILGCGLCFFGAFRLTTDWMRLKPVEIIRTNVATEADRRLDEFAHKAKDAFDADIRRTINMAGDARNDSSLNAFAAQFDTLGLESAMDKARAVDSAVNAAIASGTFDYGLYGENRWATPYETLRNGKGDNEDIAVLKFVLLDRLGVPLKDRFISVSKTNEKARQVVEVMVDTAGNGKAEDLVMLEAGQTQPAPLSSKSYAYHIGLNQDGIRYLTPALTP